MLGANCWQQINNIWYTAFLSLEWKYSNRWQQTSSRLCRNLWTHLYRVSICPVTYVTTSQTGVPRWGRQLRRSYRCLLPNEFPSNSPELKVKSWHLHSLRHLITRILRRHTHRSEGSIMPGNCLIWIRCVIFQRQMHQGKFSQPNLVPAVPT